MFKKAVALGNFDGMHKGHIAVLDKTLEAAQSGLSPFVLLFAQHSEKALRGFSPPMLMTDNERRSFLKNCGFEIFDIDFNEIKNMMPEEFVEEILIKRMNAQAAVCGYNYRFGKNAVGSAETLRKICTEKGIDCYIADEVDFDGKVISSTEIRRLIENGEIKKVNEMLGKHFGFTSPVIHGDRRGRSWGFPTANQMFPQELVMPKFGVYSSLVTVDGKTYKGITNIGKRPTVGTETVLSETNILDFSDEIYGKSVDIRLLEFIRPEKKFSSFEELAQQIKHDIDSVKGSDC